MTIPSDKVLLLPYRGAPQTMGLMRRSAQEAQSDYVVRQVVQDVCQGVSSKDYVSEYLALYYTILQRCRYMRDPRTVELVRSPIVVCRELAAGKTPSLDCDDMAVLLASWILACGGSARFVTVAFRKMYYQGRLQYSHVLCEAQDPRNGQWIVLDPVAAEKTKQMLGRVKAAALWPIA